MLPKLMVFGILQMEQKLDLTFGGNLQLFKKLLMTRVIEFMEYNTAVQTIPGLEAGKLP